MLQANCANQGILQNTRGRYFRWGKKNPLLGDLIRQSKKDNPHWTITEIANQTQASVSTVHKSIYQKEKVKKKERQHVLGEPALHLALALISDAEQSSLTSIKQQIDSALGENFHLSSYSRLLKNRVSKRVAKRVDPRKFSEQNMEYFLKYVYWQNCLPIDDSMKLAFLDEARIDRTGV